MKQCARSIPVSFRRRSRKKFLFVLFRQAEVAECTFRQTELNQAESDVGFRQRNAPNSELIWRNRRKTRGTFPPFRGGIGGMNSKLGFTL